MILTGATKKDIENALQKVNESYGGNIIFNRMDAMNTKGTRFCVTLRCISSKGLGHRVSYNGVPFGRSKRRMVSACWHVHGTFFQNLPPDTMIYTSISKQKAKEYRNPFLWPDRNIGSMAFPCMASESCECHEH